MKIKYEPQAATRSPDALDRIEEAWFYEYEKCIDVYIRHKAGENAAVCRISRAKLADWLKRTEPK